MAAHLPRCNAAIYPYGAVCRCDEREALAAEFNLTQGEVDDLLTEAWELGADPAELAVTGAAHATAAPCGDRQCSRCFETQLAGDAR